MPDHITEHARQNAAAGIDYTGCPEHLQVGLRQYIEEGVPPGGFLQHVLANDLREAWGRCSVPLSSMVLATYLSHPALDSVGALKGCLLSNLLAWLSREAPAPCWGSPEALVYWTDPRYLGSIEVEAAKRMPREESRG